MPGNRTRTLTLLLAGWAVGASGVVAWAGGVGFRTQHLLEEHYLKYGRDFGEITREQYLRMAQQLRDARPGKNILVTRRPDGGGAKFDKRQGWFVAYDGDRTLRTFFIPNDGIRFFERQTRSHKPPE